MSKKQNIFVEVLHGGGQLLNGMGLFPRPRSSYGPGTWFGRLKSSFSRRGNYLAIMSKELVGIRL